jgi:hypothetical protein
MNLVPGGSMSLTGVIVASGVEDWVTIQLPQGLSEHLVLRNASSDGGGSEFQMQAYSGCATSMGATTTGSGEKTLDLPGNGPRTVMLRISASTWDVARPTYSLRIEAR